MLYRRVHGVQFQYLGLIDYDEGLAAQGEALRRLNSNELVALVLGLEHSPVVTLGVRGDANSDVRYSREILRLKGLQLRSAGRGGQATIHSPGQLVIYPCLNLRAFGIGARAYVEMIEKTTLEWLEEVGVSATRGLHEPGLFVRDRKIAAFGFQISHGFTSHGIAVNVTNDLSLFEAIRTCGVSGQPLARLSEFGVEATLEALFLGWQSSFERNLSAIDVDESGPGPLP